MEHEPTLEEVIDRVKHAEVVAANQCYLKPLSTSKVQDISPVQKSNQQNKKNKNFKKNNKREEEDKNPKTPDQQQPNTSTGANPKRCGWCGHQERHAKNACPAREDVCGHCKNVGHWSTVCIIKKKQHQQQEKSKNVNTVENNPQNPPSSSSDSFYFSSIEVDSTTQEEVTPPVPPILRTLTIQEKTQLVFKCDTGADASVLGPDHYAKCIGLPPIRPIDTTLRGPDRQILRACGVRGRTHTT
ncbi:Gag-Pol polyprotein [Frankliniella fusca]|uniref:Gag-Pol polyprotein n=1 Tax=Frankliniella fusca TaxID=407009 RepID=A0AAE1I0X4_9NEOP|nr:Gag-Pol polyprotein [Frankliniella fusca]